MTELAGLPTENIIEYIKRAPAGEVMVYYRCPMGQTFADATDIRRGGENYMNMRRLNRALLALAGYVYGATCKSATSEKVWHFDGQPIIDLVQRQNVLDMTVEYLAIKRRG